jgi:broad specificity phosphatase PhoE
VRLYIIRHGETDHNRNRVMQGHGANPLNDRGIAQIARLADRLSRERVDRIIASDLLRTVMTGAIIAARTAAPLTYDALLRERNPGDLTGLPYDQAMAFFDDPGFAPPNGETQLVFESRVRTAFDLLAARFGSSDAHLAIVTHGMVCAAFNNVYLQGDGAITGPGWANGSVTIVQFDDGIWIGEQIGDASHLDCLGPEDSHPTGG